MKKEDFDKIDDWVYKKVRYYIISDNTVISKYYLFRDFLIGIEYKTINFSDIDASYLYIKLFFNVNYFNNIVSLVQADLA